MAGCWFHYAQAVMKRVNKLGIKAEYVGDDDDVKKNVDSDSPSLPLLPARDMRDAVSDIQPSLNADSPNVIPVKQLIAYVNWPIGSTSYPSSGTS